MGPVKTQAPSLVPNLTGKKKKKKAKIFLEPSFPGRKQGPPQATPRASSPQPPPDLCLHGCLCMCGWGEGGRPAARLVSAKQGCLWNGARTWSEADFPPRLRATHQDGASPSQAARASLLPSLERVTLSPSMNPAHGFPASPGMFSPHAPHHQHQHQRLTTPHLQARATWEGVSDHSDEPRGLVMGSAVPTLSPDGTLPGHITAGISVYVGVTVDCYSSPLLCQSP